MSRPRFLADEDLRGSMVHAVRRIDSSVEIAAVVELGLASITDEQLLDFAWQNHWLVVSHDVNTLRSFSEVRVADGRRVHGLFLAPQQRSTLEVANCLVMIA